MIAARFIESERVHCAEIVMAMRVGHLEALGRLGIAPTSSLQEMFDLSYRRRSVMIDNELAVLAGVAGSFVSAIGFTWAAVSENATRYPVTMVRALQSCLDDFMVGKDELVTNIIDGDDKALKLAIFLGFHVTTEGFGQRAFSRPGRRMLESFIADESGLHHPYGQGTLVRMGVQAQELH